MQQEDEKKAVKEAFERVKNDIFALNNEFSTIRNDIFELKSVISGMNLKLETLEKEILKSQSKNSLPTHPQIIPTHLVIPTDIPTVPMETGGLKYQNFDISNGNRGVPTDRQTNQQTGIPTQNFLKNEEKTVDETINKASELLSSLDSVKKEIRRKFRNITQQEMLIFSTIYQLEDQSVEADYRFIAQKLGLSESSIRDYVKKLISKGIPVVKNKVNNKKILLGISQNLKKIAPLQTIIKLREL